MMLNERNKWLTNQQVASPRTLIVPLIANTNVNVICKYCKQYPVIYLWHINTKDTMPGPL